MGLLPRTAPVFKYRNTAMKLTAQIKLLPSEKQPKKLLQTLERANEACDWISGQAWEDGTFSQYGIHKIVCYDARERFELSAQMTVRAIGKVADAYKTDPRHSKQLLDPWRIPLRQSCPDLLPRQRRSEYMDAQWS